VIKPRRTRQAGYATHMLKVTVEWLALLFPMQEVFSFNLGPEAGYNDYNNP
jgi:hypothetical protein